MFCKTIFIFHRLVALLSDRYRYSHNIQFTILSDTSFASAAGKESGASKLFWRAAGQISKIWL
jgi:hypothetical protein